MGIPITGFQGENILLSLLQTKEICHHLALKRLGHLRGVNHFISISKLEADILAFVVEYGNAAHVVNIVNLYTPLGHNK